LALPIRFPANRYLKKIISALLSELAFQARDTALLFVSSISESISRRR
jgi:hypothetical protein